jgi:hypothetical protein
MPNYVFADFSTAGGTIEAKVASGTAVVSESPISTWLRSEDARIYEGHWVLLDDHARDVLDHDLSPTALRERHPNMDDGKAIVFVPATTVRLGA